MGLAIQAGMLSTATTQGKRGYGLRQQPSRRGSPRQVGRQQDTAQPPLKALSADADAPEVAVGDDVAGLPLGQIPDGDGALEAAAPANDSGSESANETA